jgi:hypothetical protein
LCRDIHGFLCTVCTSVNRFFGDWQGLIWEAKRHVAAAQDRMKAVAYKRMHPVLEFQPSDQVLISIKYADSAPV